MLEIDITEPGAYAAALLRRLPALDSPTARADTYQRIASVYVLALRRGEPRQPAIEKAFADLAIPDFAPAVEACYILASNALTVPAAEACVRRLATQPDALGAGMLDRLCGTVLFERGCMTEALPHFRAAAAAIPASVDVHLHRHLAMALRHTGHDAECCAVVTPLFRTWPKLPDIRQLLAACGPGGDGALVRTLQEDRGREMVEEARLRPPIPLPPVELPQLGGSMLPLYATDRRTLIVFFSTWCGPCCESMPDLNRFACSPRGQSVRLIGVRTITRREREPLEQFLDRYRPQFPIVTDTAESTTLRQTASAVGRRLAVPLLVMVSREGCALGAHTSAPFDDPEQELAWLVRLE